MESVGPSEMGGGGVKIPRAHCAYCDLTDTTTLIRDSTKLYGDLSTFYQIVESVGPSEMGGGGGGGGVTKCRPHLFSKRERRDICSSKM